LRAGPLARSIVVRNFRRRRVMALYLRAIYKGMRRGVGYGLWTGGLALALVFVLSAGLARAQVVMWESYIQSAQAAQAAGNYKEARRLYGLALKEAEKLGPHDSRLAISLERLGSAYDMEGNYPVAIKLYRRALGIYSEADWKQRHPNIAALLNNLALVYIKHGRYSEAQPLLEKALALGERRMGPKHPTVANTLNNMGMLFFHEKKYS